MSSQSSNDLPLGRLGPQTTWSEYNSLAFVINSFLSKIQTATLVKIVSCTNSGGVSPVGLVDVIPLVDQIDGLGVPVPHVTLFNIPYFRAQGGQNAIILDPQAGDIGICVFASRDISKVKSSKKSSPPDSLRQFSYSDGLYVGGVLNGSPTQYVQFSTDGIKIHSPAAVILEAPDVQILAQTVEINATSSTTITTPTFTVNGNSVLNGSVSQTGGGSASFSGSVDVVGDVVADGSSLTTHTHGGVQTGDGSTGGPQ